MMSSGGKRQLTIAVVFHNEETNLPRLLSSFSEKLSPDFLQNNEMLFIDNASMDKSVDIVGEWLTSHSSYQCRLLKRRINNMGSARQQALDEALTDWVVFIDADTSLCEDWARKLLKSVKQTSPGVAIVGGGEEYQVSQKWHQFVLPLAAYFPLGKNSGLRTAVSHVPTNNCLMNKTLIQQVGGFNSFYEYVGEDLDLTTRVTKQFEIQYDPSFKVKHHLGESVFDWYSKMARYGRAQSFVWLNNFEGLPAIKFLPLLYLLFIASTLLSFPVTGLFGLCVLFSIPRTRFYSLSFLFYGLGELVGLIIGLYKTRVENSVALESRLS